MTRVCADAVLRNYERGGRKSGEAVANLMVVQFSIACAEGTDTWGEEGHLVERNLRGYEVRSVVKEARRPDGFEALKCGICARRCTKCRLRDGAGINDRSRRLHGKTQRQRRMVNMQICIEVQQVIIGSPVTIKPYNF